jgi:glutathione synthase/RimK-type ligase-like ATP-grasp enzyme
MFLIIGYKTESTIKHFLHYLKDNESLAKFDLLDLSELNSDSEIDITYKNDLLIKLNKKEFDFSKYSKIYSRCFIQDFNDSSSNYSTLNFIQLLSNYLDSCDKVVVNPPSSGYSNYSKLLHIMRLKKAGFSVPETFIFGSEESSKAVLSIDDTWISKGISSIRTKAVNFDFSLYLNLDLLSKTPSLFQKKIKGFDVRIHLIADKSVSLKILSTELDYRYSKENNKYEEISLPPEIESKCILYCKSEKLIFAGIDFKVDENLEWHLLEVNPMPGYNYFDKKLEGKISKLLYDYLSSNQTVSEDKPIKYSIDRPFISKQRRTMT